MAELPPFIIHFHRLRWHRVHAARAVHAGAHAGLPDGGGRGASTHPRCSHYVQRENVPPQQTRALHHYRIYLGEGGCHEAFAQSVYSSGDGTVSRAFASFANGVRQRPRIRQR